jgi:hypothetical protein
MASGVTSKLWEMSDILKVLEDLGENSMNPMSSIFAVVLLCLSVTAALANDFCAGFERGFITGYKRASRSSLDPLTPLCPLQPLKQFGDPDSDFEHGYVIGFERGMIAGSHR